MTGQAVLLALMALAPPMFLGRAIQIRELKIDALEYASSQGDFAGSQPMALRRPAAAISGKVVLSDGKPVAGAW
jgi:hypothetical protein